MVLAHDWPNDAEGQARPYGIYDFSRNRGYVRVGNSHDTPRFAVESITQWWRDKGRAAYPHAKRLLILADAGGSNAYRSRVWKQQLQKRLCDDFGLTVTVCHYPTGSSKWNPIEHRLFSFISINWAGKPLRTFKSLIGYIANTVTVTGLTVAGVFGFGQYKTGEEVSDAEWKSLNIQHHPVCPKWNYTLGPRSSARPASLPEKAS